MAVRVSPPANLKMCLLTVCNVDAAKSVVIEILTRDAWWKSRSGGREVGPSLKLFLFKFTETFTTTRKNGARHASFSFIGSKQQQLSGSHCRRRTLFFWTLNDCSLYNFCIVSSYKSPKTINATMMLMFDPVTLLYGLKCWTFLFYLLSEASVQLSDRHSAVLAVTQTSPHLCYGSVNTCRWIRGGMKLPSIAPLGLSDRRRGRLTAVHLKKPSS